MRKTYNAHNVVDVYVEASTTGDAQVVLHVAAQRLIQTPLEVFVHVAATALDVGFVGICHNDLSGWRTHHCQQSFQVFMPVCGKCRTVCDADRPTPNNVFRFR